VENLSKNKQMDTKIKHNDAFRVLSTTTGINGRELEERIAGMLIFQQLIEQHYFDYGKTIQEILDLNGWEIKNFIELIFPGNTNKEIPELLKSIYVWGDGSEYPCPQCGCEMESEDDSEGGKYWTNWKCENPNCDHTDINNPDWDTMPGGIDHDNQ
jgi:hypothetical protein